MYADLLLTMRVVVEKHLTASTMIFFFLNGEVSLALIYVGTRDTHPHLKSHNPGSGFV